MTYKALFVSDSHDAPACIGHLEKFINEHSPKLVIFAGDITNNTPQAFAVKLFTLAKSMSCKVAAVGGNMDSLEVHKWLEAEGVSLHARKVVIDGHKLAGLGGGIEFRHNTPVEYTEAQFASALEGLLDNDTILVSHTPPYDTVADITSAGVHAGSKSVRDAILKHQPKACLCGHIHEASGSQMLGNTLLLKIQPLKDGHAVLLDLDTREYKLL